VTGAARATTRARLEDPCSERLLAASVGWYSA
jgi:hypothetical protein